MQTNQPLYKIANDYRMILDGLWDDEQSALDALETITDELNTKCINIASYIKNLEAQSLGIYEALTNMRARYSIINNKIDFLKSYLLHNLEQCAVKQINADEFDIRVKHNPPALVIDDESAIPADYKHELTLVKVDKDKLKADLGLGVVINGCHVVQNTRIEIK